MYKIYDYKCLLIHQSEYIYIYQSEYDNNLNMIIYRSTFVCFDKIKMYVYIY